MHPAALPLFLIWLGAGWLVSIFEREREARLDELEEHEHALAEINEDFVRPSNAKKEA